MSSETLMRQEVRETPAAVGRLLTRLGADLKAAGEMLRTLDPRVVATIARGSSDHAATFLKYAVEMRCGVPVASLGPSLASVYGTRLRLDGAAAIAVSQSGRSPDIVALLEAARAGGAETMALVNAPGSPCWGTGRGDGPLLAALEALPAQLEAALDADWSAALAPCLAASSLHAIGRGPTFAIPHAECFSGAEILHGPVSLVEPASRRWRS